MKKEEIEKLLLEAKGYKRYYAKLFNHSVGFFNPSGSAYYDAEHAKWESKVDYLESLLE